MPDAAYTDEFGYPLSALQVLQRRRRKTPLHTGAVERAGFAPMPAAVQQLAEEADKEVRKE